MADDFEINLDFIEKLTRSLAQIPKIEIGILDDSPRTDGKSNVVIGTTHEYGAPAQNIPMRSFLRIPLMDKLNNAINHSEAFDDNALKEIVKAGNLTPWATEIAKIGKEIVLGAFDSRGYGQWVEHAPDYENTTGKILEDTGQLRAAIAYKVTY